MIVEQKIPEWKDLELRKISQETLDEVLEKLYKNNRVLAVRPTGFGKSFMLAGLTSNKLENGENRFKKCLYVYPTTVIKQDVINTYGPAGNDERAGKLQNTTFISYMKLTNMINDLEKENKTTVEAMEMYPGIYDISSDGDWIKDGKKRAITSTVIETYIGKNGLRNWFRQFDLIMLDECHRAGSEGFLRTWEKIESIITGSEKTKLVGVTATPDRLDGKDIKEIFGKLNQISRLTLKDCISRNLLSKFDYVYVVGNRQRFLDTAIDDINARRRSSNNPELHEYEIEELNREINKMPPISEVIKNSISDIHTGGNNYMKFVVFFRDRKHLGEMKNSVESWFRDAFPDKDLKVHNIVTKGGEELNYEITDIDQISMLKPTENRLDLIFCVDKLNMGYHVESITGVMLLRETSSAIVYNQQIGRCFSVRSMNKPIIFDIIDKCGAGSIIDKNDKDKSELGKGTKKDLPSIIDKTCVDVHNFSYNFLDMLAKMRQQKYSKKEDIVRFLSEDRHAPVEVISQMTGFSMQEIKSIIG